MRNIFKRTAVALLALVMLCSALLMSGCSTPKIAMTVDGDEYTTGEYLAALHNTFQQVYIQGSLYYYEMYSTDTDIWGEEDYEYEGEKYGLADYISALTQDAIVRQVAVKRLMAEKGITLSEEDKKAIAEDLAELKTDAYIDLGFNNESYARIWEESKYNESGLFYALYGEGGKTPVPSADVRKYFDDNYLSYMIISTTLQDSKGKDLSAEEKAKVKKQFEDYLALYEKDKDFDAVIHQFEADEKAKSEAEASTTTTTVAGATTTTTTTTTTTVAPTTTTTGAGETTTTTAHDHEDEDEEEEEEHNHRVDVDAAADDTESELEKAIKAMAFDEVKILEYTDNEVPTIALVLKMDPEADRGKDEDGKDVDYYADQVETILYQLKFDEFDKMVKEKVETLDVNINKTAVNACDPYDFRVAYFGE